MPPRYAILKSAAMLLVAVVAVAADDDDLKNGAASGVDLGARWWEERPTAEAEVAAAEWERWVKIMHNDNSSRRR